MSTGQNIIGFNMFAYCLNDPVNCVDFSGKTSLALNGWLTYERRITDEGQGGAYGQAAAIRQIATIVGGLFAICAVGNATATTSEREEIYDFSHSLVDTSLSTYDNKQPRVHHIVPPGEFSNRNILVKIKLHAAQAKMMAAEIDIVSDPNNLMILSHGRHKALHTNTYLLGVSKVI